MLRGIAVTVLAAVAAGVAARAASEVPAGTRFEVALTRKLDARKIKPGRKVRARTVEAIHCDDGSVVPAGALVTGYVSNVRPDQMILRFERIETNRGRFPIVATVAGVAGQSHVRVNPGEEGEISASRGRGRAAAIGAALVGGMGAVVGASQAGGKGAVIGAGSGAAAGAVVGSAVSGRDLVLEPGARIEIVLGRPLTF
jgi:hypothetical protein